MPCTSQPLCDSLSPTEKAISSCAHSSRCDEQVAKGLNDLLHCYFRDLLACLTFRNLLQGPPSLLLQRPPSTSLEVPEASGVGIDSPTYRRSEDSSGTQGQDRRRSGASPGHGSSLTKAFGEGLGGAVGGARGPLEPLSSDPQSGADSSGNRG